jgi:hypothetical protein
VRLTIVSSKTFEAEVAVVEKAMGQPEMLKFGKVSSGVNTFAELENRLMRKIG